MLCHNMCSPVGTIASGHACVVIRSFMALESDSVAIPDGQHVVQWDGPLYKDGYLEIPNKPGLGIALNEDVCRKHLSGDSSFFD
jgi:L-alanine-DL-glutamate epimerase-like enolase superfamily enzyme